MLTSTVSPAAFTIDLIPWETDVDEDVAAAAAPLVLDAVEWEGCDLSDVQVRAGDAGAMSALSYEAHKRGRNWFARLTGKNAANMNREFLKLVGRQVDYQAIAVGEAFEVGADYYSGSGNPHRFRHYGVALENGDDRFVFAIVETAAQAMKLARTRRENLAKLNEKVAA